MSAAAVGTLTRNLTTRQVLHIADAALEFAANAKIAIEVSSVKVDVDPYCSAITLYAPGVGATLLAYELGITRRRATPSSSIQGVTVESFSADWCGIRLTILHTVPTEPVLRAVA